MIKLIKLDVNNQCFLDSSVSTPTQSLSPRKGDMANGVNRTKQTDNSSVGTSEDGDEQQPILVEEEDDNQVIMDMLSNVQVPMVCITFREMLVTCLFIKIKFRLLIYLL